MNTKTKVCPECGSINVSFDSDFGFYTCNDCDAPWAFAEDDPDYDEDPIETYGTCCACRQANGTVRNFVMIERQAPILGTGWGCLVCGLSNDGAVAVICDSCLSQMERGEELIIQEAISGYPKDLGRISFAQLIDEFPEFKHNLALHQDAEKK